MGRLALTGSAISILVALVALAGLGWAYVSAQSGSMTMSVGADFESFAIFLATWVVMMAAMMFPSVAPVVLVYAQYTRRQGGAMAAARDALRRRVSDDLERRGSRGSRARRAARAGRRRDPRRAHCASGSSRW